MTRPDNVEGECIANVEVRLRGVFPAKWSSFELPSIIEQILARGIEYSPHASEVQVTVTRAGGSSISSREVSPCSCGHSFEMHPARTACYFSSWAGRCDCDEYNRASVEDAPEPHIVEDDLWAHEMADTVEEGE